jgi:hypothetical protein
VGGHVWAGRPTFTHACWARFMGARLDRYVLAEYDNAPPDYISLAKSG